MHLLPPAFPATLADLTPDDQRKLAKRLIIASHAVRRQRSNDVPSEDLDAYLALDWMHWTSGRLAMTGSGQAMLDQALRAFVL
jgi:hypothetical protein